KRAAELHCACYAQLFGIGATALRYFTVYGPRGRPEMAIASFARAIASGDEVPLYGDGTSARDYTYVDDIVDGTLAALDRCQAGGGFPVYTLGGARPIALARLVELLSGLLGRPARVRHLPMQPGDVPRTAADVGRAARELGWQPRIAIEDGLKRTLDWMNLSRDPSQST